MDNNHFNPLTPTLSPNGGEGILGRPCSKLQGIIKLKDKVNLYYNSNNINARKNLDCLFVHAAKLQTYYPPLNVYHSCNRMSLGLIALADLAQRNNYKIKVIHTGIEKSLNKKFSFSEYVRQKQPKAIGFSLQFHHGLVDTIQLIKAAKKTLPDVFIFLGGFTATFFAKEIMESVTEVNGVIKGDSELPLLQVLEQVVINESSSFSQVPNMVWRNSGKIIENKQTYVASEDVLNDLIFTNFDLLENKDQYVGMAKAFVKANLPDRLTNKFNAMVNSDQSRICWGLPVGRGCVYNCFYCGGGAKAHRFINQRKRPIFRKPEKVIETIRDLKKMGFVGSYVSFDPGRQSQKYYIHLFRMMHEQKIKFDIIFSAWSLASKEFLDAFAEIKGPKSSYLLSPETGNEELRKKALGGHRFSNSDLLNNLSYADKLGIPSTIFFSLGALERSMEDFKKTLDLKEKIKREIKRSTVEAFLIEVEPGAPWHLDPGKYNIRLLRRTFKDFIRDHSKPYYSSMSDLGYTTGIFGDPDIEPEKFNRKLLKLKCKYFCDKRISCGFMSSAWALGRLIGIAPRPEQRYLDD